MEKIGTKNFAGTTGNTAGVRPTVTQYATPTPLARKKKSSMIWIVGVVIGIVFLFAIIGIVAFVLISRKKKKARAAAAAAGPTQTYGAPPQQGNLQQPPPMQQQYMQPSP